nr:hypothetical protein [Bacteroidales bacterium]
MKRKLLFITLILLSGCTSHVQEDFTKYVDPTIGTVPFILHVTHPKMHLPNQMISMSPSKEDYISDQVEVFPLPASLNMRITLGDITNSSWKQKMTIDHDMEVYHPWYYSTYLIDDD